MDASQGSKSGRGRATNEEDERELAHTTDPKERRKIQNRISQRQYRQKQKKRLQELEEQLSIRSPATSCASSTDSVYSYDASGFDTSGLRARDFSDAPRNWSNLALSYPITAMLNTQRSRTPTPPLPQAEFEDENFDETMEMKFNAMDFNSQGSRAVGFIHDAASDLPSDVTVFMTLPIIPIQHAFQMNMKVLGITQEQYLPNDALSPFNTGKFCGFSEETCTLEFAYNSIGVPDLRPTQTQLQTVHHPYIDLIPCPGFRDRLLRVLDSIDEDELCSDIERGLRTWGKASWYGNAVEFSQEFVDKWAVLLDQTCIETSNFWRAQRGESRLVIPTFGSSQHSTISSSNTPESTHWEN